LLGLLLSVFSLSVLAVEAPPPLSVSYPQLENARDARLQASLEGRLKRLGLMDAVHSRSLAVALVDVTDPLHPRVAEVNGDEMMYAASLPKIAILLAAFQKIRDGKLALDDQNRELLVKMIRYSSNAAATEMIHRVGGDYINDLLRSTRYRLYDSVNGGLWVGKEYGQAAAWHRDPLHNLSHGASAMKVARFYYMLQTGRLVSPKFSQEMKEILGDPGIHHKFVKGLLTSYPDAKIYRKSGTWQLWHADSALVEHDGHTYIAVALAHNPKGGEWLSHMIVELDGIILRQSPPSNDFVLPTAGVVASRGSDAPLPSSSAARSK